MEGGDGRESASRSRIVSRARRVDAPLTAALGAFDGPRVAWLPPEGPAVAGRGAAATVRAEGPDRFETVEARSRALLGDVDATDGPGPRLFGGFAFTHDHDGAAPWTGFPDAYFLLPRVQLARDDGTTWLRVTEVGPDASADAVEQTLSDAAETVADATPADDAPPGVTATERTPSRDEWRRQVRAAVERIRDGDLRKVVLASALAATLDSPFELGAAVSRMARHYENCYRFAVDPDAGAAFFGATPERLVRKRGDTVETEALAGSIARGEAPAEDEALADRLRGSEKDQHEHRLVVKAISEQLTPVADDVRVGRQSIRALDTVQHLHTPITADVAPDRHVLDVVRRLHPTPAVGGLPPDAALRTIREAESFDRGWYAAPVGWIGPDGDGAFAVGIRSGVAEGREATLFAGNGIVADSDPDEEWEEVQLKFRPMLDHLR
ncbi:MAG: isochorismate synthase MenF [Halobacteriaceae archaeon]